MKKRSILFVPRAKAWIEDLKNFDEKVGKTETLPTRMGAEKMVTLDFTGKFDLGNGDQLYVFPGHGTAGSGTVFWAGESNWLAAETVAELTAERFPDCANVSIKVYSCHSSEGGYNSFANRFARAFRPAGGTYDVTIFGYRGSITPGPKTLTQANVDISKNEKKFPDGYTGPKDSVVAGVPHRWSKADTFLFASRASEARDQVAWLKAVKGTVSQTWGV
jgi:hypothetical protein